MESKQKISRKKTGQATLIGGGAILLWATLAWLTTSAVASVPPFQLLTMAFGIAFVVSSVYGLTRGQGLTRIRRIDWVLSVGGIFLYHLFYFVAFRHLPAVEANLLNYLWPLLIVLFSGLLPGERLSARHILGALVGFTGAALVILTVSDAAPRADETTWSTLLGYGSAFACAITWSGYSVLNRRFGSAPTAAVGLFCGAAALLAIPFHLLLEPTIWPDGWIGWSAIVAMGLGPMGLAFFLWDYGVKHGNLRLLGILSYAAPVLSTGILILAGKVTPTPYVGLAVILVAGGAVLASYRRAERHPKQPA